MRVIGRANVTVIPHKGTDNDTNARTGVRMEPHEISTAQRDAKLLSPATSNLLDPESAKLISKFDAKTIKELNEIATSISKGAVDARFDKKFFNDLVKNLADPARQNQGIDASCVAAGEVRSLITANPSEAARIYKELVRTGHARMMNGDSITLSEEDFREVPPGKRAEDFGFKSRTLDELILQRSLLRNAQERFGRHGDGSTDDEIMQIRGWMRGSESMTVASQEDLRRIAEGSPEKLIGQTFSVKFMNDGHKDEYHYLTVTDVKNGEISFFEPWDKATAYENRCIRVEKNAAGHVVSKTWGLDDFISRTRVGFFDAGTMNALNKTLGIRPSADTTSTDEGVPVVTITGFYIHMMPQVSKPVEVAASKSSTPAFAVRPRFDNLNGQVERKKVQDSSPEEQYLGRALHRPERVRKPTMENILDEMAQQYHIARSKHDKDDLLENPLLDGSKSLNRLYSKKDSLAKCV